MTGRNALLSTELIKLIELMRSVDLDFAGHRKGQGSIPGQALIFRFFFHLLGCSFYCEDHVHLDNNNITKQKQTIEPFLKTSNTFHQRLARQISSTDPQIDWSVA